MKSIIFSWGMVLAYVTLNSGSALIIKRKLNEMGPANTSSLHAFIKYFFVVFTSPVIIASFIAIFASAIAWMVALSKMNVSIAYPTAVALNFLIVIACSLLFLGESMTLQKAIGVILLLVAILLLSCK